MIDRQHLAILREFARAGGVTAAADRLNLSQSAISHSIAKLENRHQVKLWRKKGRKLELTQAGRYLLTLAERIVPELEHAERTLAEFSQGRRGTLRIGMECHPCEKWLMRVTGPYLSDWPDVDIELTSEFQFDGIAALQANEIDMLVTPDPMAIEGLTFTPVFDYELMLAVHGAHPFAIRPFVRPDDLVDQHLLTVPVSVDRLDIYTRFLIPADCRPHQRTLIESTDLMLQFVSAGRGIAVLPDWLIKASGAGMDIQPVRIGPAGLFKSITLGTRREDAGIDYLSAFQAVARQVRP